MKLKFGSGKPPRSGSSFSEAHLVVPLPVPDKTWEEDECIQYNVGLIPLISLTSLSLSHSTQHRRKRWENYLSYPGSSSLRLINGSSLHLVIMLWCVFGGCANGSFLWVDLHVPVQKLLFGRKGQGQAFPWRRCSAALLTRLIYLWRIQGIHWCLGTAVRVLKEEQKIVFLFTLCNVDELHRHP